MSLGDGGPVGWMPAPGSVTRRNWPLALRWTWWLAHRPLLVVAVGVALLFGVELGPMVLVVALVVVAAGLVAWWRLHPASFHPTAGCCWACGGRSGPMGCAGARR
jgi:hypothetical protein